MTDLCPALCGLRDLRDALIFGAASGLGLAARQQLGDVAEPRVVLASARLSALREQIRSSFRSTAFLSFISRVRDEYDKKLETVLVGVATSTDIESLLQLAETFFATSLCGYGYAPQTADNRRYLIEGLTKILHTATTQTQGGGRAPTDDEIANIVNRLYPIKMPRISNAETEVRAIIAAEFGRPAGAIQLRAVLELPGFAARRHWGGRPRKAP